MMNLKENFMLGALAYKFKTVNKSLTNVDGHELDVFRSGRLIKIQCDSFSGTL